MARLVYGACLLLAVNVHVTAAFIARPNLKMAESGISQASLASPKLTTAESGIVQASTSRVPTEQTNDMKKRVLKAKEFAKLSSPLSPSGPDPTHDSFNMSNTNLANSTLYNSYGALNASVNRTDTKGANSGNPLPQLGLVLYIWLILPHICIWCLFG